MIINQPKLNFDNGLAIYSADINFYNESHRIEFSVSDRYKDMITETSDPLLIALLIPAMYIGEDIVIRGAVSKKLLYGIRSQTQDLLCTVIPGLKKINVHADNIVENKQITTSVLAGFSAGVDAYVTLNDYYLYPKYDLKITHFLFNNLTFKQEKVEKKFKRIKELSEYYKFPIIETSTNLHFFYSYNKKIKNINFEQTHTLRNSAVAHFLGANGSKFLYSSTYHFSHVKVSPSEDLAIIDPILLPTISSDTVECISVGSEYTRLEKTLKITEIPTTFDYLDLCIGKDDNFINCGVCRKCKRALALFEVSNNLDKYKNIFNLQEWYKIRDSYLKNLSAHTQLNDKELYLYMIENNYLSL